MSALEPSPVSRIVPATEKTCPAHLYNAEGYRQVVAFRFAMGDRVSRESVQFGTRVEGIVEEIACSVQDGAIVAGYRLLYGGTSGSKWYTEDSLELVEVTK